MRRALCKVMALVIVLLFALPCFIIAFIGFIDNDTGGHAAGGVSAFVGLSILTLAAWSLWERKSQSLQGRSAPDASSLT